MIVTTLAHGRLVLQRFMQYKHVAVDSETQAAPGHEQDKKAALIIGRARIRLWSMCHRGESYSFPTNLLGAYPTMHEWARLFRPLFKKRGIRKVFHNFNYDGGNAFKYYNVSFAPIWDTLYGCHYANANYDRDLKSRANLYGRYIAQTSTVDFQKVQELADYGEDDVIATDEFYQMQTVGIVIRPKVIECVNEEGIMVHTKNPMPELKLRVEHENLRNYDRLVLKYQELPVLRAVVRAEAHGVPINRPQVWAINNKLKADNQKTLAEIYRLAGGQINVGSNPAVAKLLTKLGVTGLGVTKKGGVSVGGPSLFFVQDQHPIVRKILDYRGRVKLRGYVNEKGLERYADDKGYIHSTLNSLGARTGRMSSQNPNLQNIPAAKDTYGLRSCFVAPKGQHVICLDFSQIEIRIMAILCKDPEMCRVLTDPDGDIHQNTAEQFQVDRSPTAKQINFLMLYGGGPFALSQKLTLEGAPTEPDLAKTYIDKYDEVYGGVHDYRLKLLHQHQREGFCEYLIGRRRYLLDVDWSSRREKHKAETTLSNNICQGSAQDWLKASIVRGDPQCINPDREILKRMTFSRSHTALLRDYARKLDKLRADMVKAHTRWVLQVHDETLYFCDKSAAQEIGMRIAEMMTWCPYFEPITSIDVPIVVDGGVGVSWAHAKGKEPLFKLEHYGKTFGVAA